MILLTTASRSRLLPRPLAALLLLSTVAGCRSQTPADSVQVGTAQQALLPTQLSFVPGWYPVETVGDGQAIGVGDFDRDGRWDLVISHAGTVGVRRGTAPGVFGPEVSIASSGTASAFAVADFDRNGRDDLLVVEPDGDQVSLWLAGIWGEFAPAPLVAATGSHPVAAAVADFNHDGRPDVAVANHGASSASVLLGNGDGTFQPQLSVALTQVPNALGVGDFNRDGLVDLAAATDSGVCVLLGVGDGTFQAAQCSATGGEARALLVVDLDHDGKLDLAAAVSKAGVATLEVLLGSGSGTFTAQPDLAAGAPAGTEPTSLVSADFDGDGRLDLALSLSGSVTQGVLVFSGNGDGTFRAAQPFAANGAPVTSMLLADFDADGQPDLVARTASVGSARVLFGTTRREIATSYEPHGDFATGAGPNTVSLADLDDDGNLDAVAVDGTANTVSVLLANGDGTFKAKVDYATGAAPKGLVIADLNGDGKPDLAVANSGAASVSVLRGNGDGSFQGQAAFPTGNSPNSLTVADFDGNGTLDLATANTADNTVSVLLNTGSSFQAPVNSPVATAPSQAIAGDFDLDGRPDLVVAATNSSYATSTLVYRGQGDGTFVALVGGYAVLHIYTSLIVADLEPDGAPDVIALNASNQAQVFSNTHFGRMQALMDSVASGNPLPIRAAADLNGDGKPDLAVANQAANTVSVWWGGGDGTFASRNRDFPTGAGPVALAVGDLDHDGKLDLVSANLTGNSLTVLLGAPGSLGTACRGPDDCRLGMCVDGVCCDSPCTDTCEACDLSGSVGTCSIVPLGTPIDGFRPGCRECETACDGISRGCSPKPTGTACFVYEQCVKGQTCETGRCIGPRRSCPPPDQCHEVATCSATDATCPAYTAKPNGTACSLGDACTGVGTCQSGLCTSSAPVVCAANQCSTAGACDPIAGCSKLFLPAGTACDDGNACTANDSCQAGACGGTPVVCPGSDQCRGVCNPADGSCSDTVKPDGAACDDGDPDTLTDHCIAGSCTGMRPRPRLALGGFACRIKPDGTTSCWGPSAATLGQGFIGTPPNEPFVSLSVGWEDACGVKADGTLLCWGRNLHGATDVPPGKYQSVSVGVGGTCAVRLDGTLACWGSLSYGEDKPPSGTFTHVSMGWDHACALRTDATIACWGQDYLGMNYLEQNRPPPGRFADVATGEGVSCGLREDGTITCWYLDPWIAAPPSGTFKSVTLALTNACALRTDDTVVCWGGDPPPPGPFAELSAVSSMARSNRLLVTKDGDLVASGWQTPSTPQVITPAALPVRLNLLNHACTTSLAFGESVGHPEDSYRFSQYEPRFTVIDGALPPGMRLNREGTLTGRPARGGDYPFTVGYIDTNGFVVTKAYTLRTDANAAYGDPCRLDSECERSFPRCIDNVCCACTNPSSARDCTSCLLSKGAVRDGVCLLLSGAGCNDGDACTQGEACQNGLCAGGSAVTCAAKDQCHDVGTCSPATGCSDPPKADGSACEDGTACTRSDACQGGTCTGSDPVVCSPPDGCHEAVCDAATGTCSTPARPDGSSCDDGDLCTSGDTCQGGSCAAGGPVVCSADQCHAAGACDPAGGCAKFALADGATCDDGAACTRGDVCTGGVCGGTSYACEAPGACQATGTCNGDGTCSFAAQPDGTSCDDGDACTLASLCRSGACVGTDPVVCPAPDECHSGACQPATGQCTTPAKADGTACTGGSCFAGACLQGVDGGLPRIDAGEPVPDGSVAAADAGPGASADAALSAADSGTASGADASALLADAGQLAPVSGCGCATSAASPSLVGVIGLGLLGLTRRRRGR
jgi:MYXO-CTERM domain-containing protein